MTTLILIVFTLVSVDKAQYSEQNEPWVNKRYLSALEFMFDIVIFIGFLCTILSFIVTMGGETSYVYNLKYKICDSLENIRFN